MLFCDLGVTYKASPVFRKLVVIPAIIDPLNPAAFPFFVLILIIPEFPEASYLAEGFVMISICSNCEAGIFLSKFARSVDDKYVGLPSIIMITPAFPRR